MWYYRMGYWKFMLLKQLQRINLNLMPEYTFEFSFTVLPEHLDQLHHVNNVVYVQWLQEAASRHWSGNVTPDTDEKVLWVVRRHEIDYLAPAVLGDELIMKTWTGRYTAVSWDRHYEITRVSDQRKIITAKSIWVLLDSKTLKPRKIDAEILAVLE